MTAAAVTVAAAAAAAAAAADYTSDVTDPAARAYDADECSTL